MSGNGKAIAIKDFSSLVQEVAIDLKTMVDPRKVFDQALTEAAQENERIFCLTADMGTTIPTFAKVLPDRYIDMGIAEQDMIGAASGMALCGKIPYVTTMACFISMRGCEQMRTDCAYQDVHVIAVGFGSGVAYGTLGSTHHALEDIGIMRSVPRMTVLSPAGAIETGKAIKAAANHPGPTYIRIGRGNEPVVYGKDYDFRIGKGVALRDGKDLAIIATGNMVATSLDAADRLALRGISARVVNMHTIKPIDEKLIIAAATGVKAVITVEDHNIIGGLGSAVAEVLSEKRPTFVHRLGIPDAYPIVGAAAEIYEEIGLTGPQIAEKCEKVLSTLH